MRTRVCSSEKECRDGLSSFIPVCRLDGSVLFEACLEHPPLSRWSCSQLRRGLEVVFALLLISLLALPMLAIAACVRLGSKGNALFVQKRVGLGGRLFPVYKFRSMAERPRDHAGPGLTKEGDQRVTKFGRVLRRFKLDELPQFINVLRGDMSLVGPRPKLPQYAAIPNMPYRPGITGAATLAFRREEEILSGVDARHMDRFYSEHIKPLKTRLDICYMCRATPASDLRIIASTFLGCLRPGSTPVTLADIARGSSAQSISYQSTVPDEQVWAAERQWNVQTSVSSLCQDLPAAIPRVHHHRASIGNDDPALSA